MFLLKGRKRWKVFAREEIPLLGPNYFFAGGATFAHDASGQPATHVYTVDLQPGDFLIIPYGFPHEVHCGCLASCLALDPTATVAIHCPFTHAGAQR